MTATPRTAAEINTRRQDIGAELAKGRLVPVPNARALEAEDAALRLAYIEALKREGEAAHEAAEVARRIEAARQAKLAEAREARINKAVADATR